MRMEITTTFVLIRKKDEIYFLVGGDWISEYTVDIFDVVDIADEFDISCPYKN